MVIADPGTLVNRSEGATPAYSMIALLSTLPASTLWFTVRPCQKPGVGVV
jgi:hypothetical protein